MRKLKTKLVCAVTAFMAMLNFTAMNAYAAGDVASAVESTWTSANYDVKKVQSDFEEASKRLAEAQMALDRINTTVEFEADI